MSHRIDLSFDLGVVCREIKRQNFKNLDERKKFIQRRLAETKAQRWTGTTDGWRFSSNEHDRRLRIAAYEAVLAEAQS
jgi:hypothetical protein